MDVKCGAYPTMGSQDERSGAGLPLAAVQVALDTGTRPIEVGPESTQTGAHVYRRLAMARWPRSTGG
jgi:hypothetical protein